MKIIYNGIEYNRESVPKLHILNIFSNGFHFLKLKILFSHKKQTILLIYLSPAIQRNQPQFSRVRIDEDTV